MAYSCTKGDSPSVRGSLSYIRNADEGSPPWASDLVPKCSYAATEVKDHHQPDLILLLMLALLLLLMLLSDVQSNKLQITELSVLAWCPKETKCT